MKFTSTAIRYRVDLSNEQLSILFRMGERGTEELAKRLGSIQGISDVRFTPNLFVTIESGYDTPANMEQIDMAIMRQIALCLKLLTTAQSPQAASEKIETT